jgi:hypothetical protein
MYYAIREHGWVGLWRGNIPLALMRVITVLVSSIIPRIALDFLKNSMPIFSKITSSEYHGSMYKKLEMDFAFNILTDVLNLVLLYPLEYLHIMLASGAFCRTSQCFAPKWASRIDSSAVFLSNCTTLDCS